MIPTTLVGLVAFAASLGPGYVWIRAAEQRNARPDRSPLLETAELVFVGGLASTVSFLVVLTVGDALGLISSPDLAEDGSTYVLANPGRAIGSFLIALLLGYVGAWITAQLWYWRTPPTLQHGASVWHTMLAPSGSAATKGPFLMDRLPYVTAGLRDGTAVAGWAYAYTVEPAEPAHRELVLAKPLYVRARGEAEFAPAREHFLFLWGEDIRSLSIQYHAVPPQEVPGRLPRLARWRYKRRVAREHDKIRQKIMATEDDQSV